MQRIGKAIAGGSISTDKARRCSEAQGSCHEEAPLSPPLILCTDGDYVADVSTKL